MKTQLILILALGLAFPCLTLVAFRKHPDHHKQKAVVSSCRESLNRQPLLRHAIPIDAPFRHEHGITNHAILQNKQINFFIP